LAPLRLRIKCIFLSARIGRIKMLIIVIKKKI
jgi:hypothetical protein